MRSPHTWNSTQGLEPNYLDIFIYDEKADRLQLITFKEAMKYALPSRMDEEADDGSKPGCSVFQGCEGKAEAPTDARGYIDGRDGGSYTNKAASSDPLSLGANMDPTDKAQIVASLKAIPEDVLNNRIARVRPKELTNGDALADRGAIEKEIERVFGNAAFNYSWNAFQFVVELVALGVWVPFQITLSRPFIEHAMYSSIITVAGKSTGVTLFGHADMQISANTSVKTIEGHYTCHFKSVVTRPEQIYVMRDIMSVQYIAGSDVRFFGSRKMDGEANIGPRVTAMDVKSQVRNRLQFQQEYADAYESMFAFLTPFHSTEQYMQDTAFSMVGGSGLPWDIGTGEQLRAQQVGGASRLDCNFPGGLNFFLRYNRLLNIGGIHTGEDQNQRQGQDFIRLGAYNNSVCILGPHRVYSPHSTKGTYELVPGQGHWGPDALPGDARWRRGEAVTLQDARSQLVGVDVLTNTKLAVNTFA